MTNKFFLLLLAGVAGFIGPIYSKDKKDSQVVSKVWVADNGDGTYKNPVLYADFSDPDVVRVGNDYYMAASSFNCTPGLPILHSTDLVNWELISYALPKQVPLDVFDQPQHGNGVWAPCIRYHNDEYYIYYPDPDYGIYLIKAKDPKGPWSEPLLVLGGTGIIDPSPLWDNDGKAYLAHAFAGSRAGLKTVLIVHEMSPDGTKVLDNGVMVFDGHDEHTTVEGPKFYKRNGYYYIFAPAGGVKPGWQLALRSKNIFGPYELKKVLEQGSTSINGPHQGAWVDTPEGEDWFIHFQDKYAYGRVVLLEPMRWENDWPVMGVDYDGNGIGEPVTTYKKPNTGSSSEIMTPPVDDEFNTAKLGLQWQWQANPQMKWGFPSGNLGYYRLNCRPRPEGYVNLWNVPNMLLQKFPAEEFEATTKITFNHRFDGEEIAFVVMGENYQYISLKQEEGKLKVRIVHCKDARKAGPESELFSEAFDGNTVYFRITVKKDAICSFSYSTEGKKFKNAGKEFTAVAGRWIGAKIGYFALCDGMINDAGNADIDWFRVENVK